MFILTYLTLVSKMFLFALSVFIILKIILREEE